MRDYERAILLERIERDGATVGAEIPEAVEIDGRTVALRRRVVELSGGQPSPEDERQAAALVKALRGRRRELVQRIEEPSTTREAGEAIAETVAGIDRAINALTQLDGPGVQEQADRRKREDRRRWLSFLREALGQEEDRRA
ncbi:MAG: DUF5788 family protein [Halobacteriota archaeon]